MTALALRLAGFRIQRHRRRALAKLAQATPRRFAIRTDYWPKPIPLRQFDWSATDSSTYDGAPDSGNRHQIGYGRTKRGGHRRPTGDFGGRRMTRYRVSIPHANRQREFADRAEAEDYARQVLRLDPRLAEVNVTEITENTFAVRRKEKAA